MITVSEIVESVKQLSPAERGELLTRLREAGLDISTSERSADADAYTTDEFTEQLTDHFHRAKRRALETEHRAGND